MIALRLTPARPWSRLPCALDLQLAEAWVYCTPTALSASVLGAPLLAGFVVGGFVGLGARVGGFVDPGDLLAAYPLQ